MKFMKSWSRNEKELIESESLELKPSLSQINEIVESISALSKYQNNGTNIEIMAQISEV